MANSHKLPGVSNLSPINASEAKNHGAFYRTRFTLLVVISRGAISANH